MSSEDLLELLTEATEFSELPVRHNEDQENEHLAKQVPIQVDPRHYERNGSNAKLFVRFLSLDLHF